MHYEFSKFGLDSKEKNWTNKLTTAYKWYLVAYISHFIWFSIMQIVTSNITTQVRYETSEYDNREGMISTLGAVFNTQSLRL